MIAINMKIEDAAELERGNLPKNAVKLNTPKSLDEMMKKAAPVAAALCVVMFVAMFLKSFFCRTMVIHPIGIVVGFLIGALLLPVHEWLHAVVYPKEASVTIGKVKGKLQFVALCSYPMVRARFILMCLLPFALGIIPLLAFILSPAEARVWNGLMFGMAGIGMVSPFPDVYNTVVVLRQAKKSDRIMFHEDDMYRIEMKSEEGESHAAGQD